SHWTRGCTWSGGGTRRRGLTDEVSVLTRTSAVQHARRARSWPYREFCFRGAGTGRTTVSELRRRGVRALLVSAALTARAARAECALPGVSFRGSGQARKGPICESKAPGRVNLARGARAAMTADGS